MDQKLTIFISRRLAADSIFRRELPPPDYEIIDFSLIEFKAVAFQSIPKVDWLFFYSQKGVHFFFEQIQKAKLSIPKKLKWASIGSATAQALEARKVKVDFVGTGEPKSSAIFFEKLVKKQNVAFIQAQNSKQSVQKLLPLHIGSQSMVVYQNNPILNPPKPKADILVFTSPMNVKTYFYNFELELSQKVVSIGKTTAKALEEQEVKSYYIADKPKEFYLAQIILKKIKQLYS